MRVGLCAAVLHLGACGGDAPFAPPSDEPPPRKCASVNQDGSCADASGPVYLNSTSALFSFDPKTHTTSYLTSLSAPDVMADIAADMNGVLLGLGQSGRLYTINVGTGWCMGVAVVGHGANALTVTPDNHIVVAGADVELLDRSTYGVVRTLVPSGTYVSSGDIVALPDGTLYWTVVGPSNDQLVKIDPASGTTTLVGTLPASDVQGLAYASQTLFGFTLAGDYLIIDPADATATSGTTSGYWSGGTSNPVTW
jgi:hypothetical protein